jgi:hypothetical protein
MKVKKRHEMVLRNLVVGMRLERVMWDNGNGYNVYYKFGHARGRQYLAGVSNRADESSYYYFFCKEFAFDFKILFNLGLRVG